LNSSTTSHLYGWNHQKSLSGEDSPPSKEELVREHKNLRFSIVVPTLNQADTIEDTLLSIIAQNYPNTEIIVIDGGSSDRTLEILSQYNQYITYLVSEPDDGQSDAINRGFNLAQGDIFAWLNSDDYYLPKTFHKVNSLFISDKTIEFAVGAGDVISKEHSFLRHIPPLDINQYTMDNWRNDRWIMQQSCFWTRSLWERAGGVDLSLKLLMDVDLWFRFSRYTKTHLISDRLAVMRYYKDVKTVRHQRIFSEEMAYVYAKNNSYDSVRSFVAELVNEHAAQVQHAEDFYARFPIRLMKKLRLLPR